MSLFSDNLRHLRENRKESQQQTADRLQIKRGRYEPWESGKSEPPYEMLIYLSRHYGIAIDLLLNVDLRKVSVENLTQLEGNRILLPIIMDHQGGNRIEVVTQKTKAGYAAGGFADFGFISELDHVSLPWLGKNEKYRIFPIDGDSMPPHNQQSSIVGKYVEKLDDVVEGRTYVLITRNNEMVYKRVYRESPDAFLLRSDNDFYKPYRIKFIDIAEIWEYAGSVERGTFKPEEAQVPPLENIIRKLQRDLSEIREKLP